MRLGRPFPISKYSLLKSRLCDEGVLNDIAVAAMPLRAEGAIRRAAATANVG